jgi:Na+-transporting NADH:ubiquinone oxidoreductase subunit NqrD
MLAAETVFITLFVPMLSFFYYEANKTKTALVTTAVTTTVVAANSFLELRKRVIDALKLSALIIVLSLIREPLGYATLSLPFGSGGITELFNQDGAFAFPIEIVSVSSGAFLILGFIVALFRAFDRRKTERL